MYTFAKFSLALVTFHGLMGNNISVIPRRLNKANKSYFYPRQMEFFATCCFPPRATIESTRTTIRTYHPNLRIIRTQFKLIIIIELISPRRINSFPRFKFRPSPRYLRSNFSPRSIKTLDLLVTL